MAEPTIDLREATSLAGVDMRHISPAGANFRPLPLNPAELAKIGAMIDDASPHGFTKQVNAMLGDPAEKTEMADAIIRVRLSGPHAGIRPNEALSEADLESRKAYAETSLMRTTHRPIDVATRVAVLRGKASPLKPA